MNDNKNNNSDWLIELIKGIDNHISKRFEDLKFDYTLDGKIISSDGSDLYTVEINGGESQIKTIDSKTYNVGDIVIVQIRQNNFSNKFILCKRP